MQYDAIIFDLDGTLIDSTSLWEKAYFEVLGKRDIPFTSELFNELYPKGIAFTEWAVHLGIDEHDVADIRTERDKVYEHLLQTQTALYEDADMFLAEMLHMPKAIVTGSHRSYVDAIQERIDLQGITDTIVTVDDVLRGKPDPEGLHKAAEMLGVDSAKCVYIGDQPFDADAAKNAGMDCVIVRRTHTPNEFLRADHKLVELLTELLP